MSAAPSRRRAWTRAGALAVAVLVVDQATKAAVRGSIDLGGHVHVLPFLDLVHVRNEGVAFGALGGAGTAVVVAVAAALIGIAVFFLANARRAMVWLPTGLLLGGAIGNIVDRARAGAVTDFIKFPHWPAFNVADMAITIGVLTLFLVVDAHRGR